MERKVRLMIQVLIFSVIILNLQGCQEFIHDSFDTYQGTVVDESGIPVADLELSLYSEVFILSDILPLEKTPIYVVKTDAEGQFKMVLPSRNYDGIYTLVTNPSFLFVVDQFESFVNQPYLNLNSSLRDERGIIDLGTLTVVQP